MGQSLEMELTNVAKTKKWLILAYMQAGDTTQLDAVAALDLLEMEQGLSPHARVVVQLQRRWPASPQRYRLSLDDGASARIVEFVKSPAGTTGADMGDPEVFGAFLGFARKEHEAMQKANRDADIHVCLLLWGHSYGLGFGRDHGDALTISELAEQLKKSQLPVSVLATNACTMGYVEGAFQLKDCTTYLVASQLFMPLAGFPFQEILSAVGPTTDPQEMGRYFVDRYVDRFSIEPATHKVALSLINVAKASRFEGHLANLAKALEVVVRQGEPVRRSPRACRELQDVFLTNPVGDERPVIDLAALASALKEYATDALLEQPDSTLTKALREVVTECDRISKDLKSLVVWSRCHRELENVNGIGVFAPFLVERQLRLLLEIEGEGRREYEQLKIFEPCVTNPHSGAKVRPWPHLVYDTLFREEPEEVVVDGIVRPAPASTSLRNAPAIDAAFNQLERVLEAARSRLVSNVVDRGTDETAPFGRPALRLAAPQAVQRIRKSVVNDLARIERALGLVERTLVKVLVGGNFGLGPKFQGDSRGFLVKNQGENHGPVAKDQGHGLIVKDQGSSRGFLAKNQGNNHGMLVKNQGENHGMLVKNQSENRGVVLDASVPGRGDLGAALADWLEAVASHLRGLEGNLEAIEAAVYASATAKSFRREALEDELGALCAEAIEAACDARRVANSVVAHPLFTSAFERGGLDETAREQLAQFAGLNRRSLALLQRPVSG